MASTVFTDAVTMVPADWANDVNALTYDVFHGAHNLTDALTALGLQWVNQNALTAHITGSTIENSNIGAVTPAQGTFTVLRVTQQGTNPLDAASVGWVSSLVSSYQGTIGTLGYQNANAVDITGGTIDGTVIGGHTPAAGTFSTLKVSATPAAATDATNKQYVDASIAALPHYGTIALQNYDAVSITGGSIDGTTIGLSAQANAKFLDVTANRLFGPNAALYLDGTLASYASYGYVLQTTGSAKPNAALRIDPTGTLSVQTTGGTTLLSVGGTGRVLINATDDNTNQLQVVGGGKFDAVTLTGAVTQATQAATKQYADSILTQAEAFTTSSITTAIAGLGTMATQNATAVAITGGAIDGVAIGANTPATAALTSGSVQNSPTAANHLVNKAYVDAQIAALPTYGSMATQSAANVDITGGTIDGTVIGGTVAANASFLTANANKIVGPAGTTYLDSSVAGYFNYGVVLAASTSNPHVAVKLGNLGTFRIRNSLDADLVSVVGGRLIINSTDDTANHLQVKGGASIDSLTLLNAITLPGQATTKQYVDTSSANTLAAVDGKITTALNALGTMSKQNASAVTITGGTMDGVTIGATTPAAGTFTSLYASTLGYSNTGNVLFNQVTRGQAVVLQAPTISKPSIEAWITTGGSFAVYNGTSLIMRAMSTGRTQFGTVTDDNVSVLQVGGQALITGQLILPQAPATANSATNKAYVDAQIASVSGSTVTPAYVQNYVTQALVPYATQTWVTSQLSGFVTQSTVNTMISNALASYPTTTQMNNAIASALTPYATQTYVQNYVTTQTANFATQAYVQNYTASNYVSLSALAASNGATLVGFGASTVNAALNTLSGIGLLTTQAANTVLAGPSSGANAAPSFRALVNADLPQAMQVNTLVVTSATIPSMTGAVTFSGNVTATAGTTTLGTTNVNNTLTTQSIFPSSSGGPYTLGSSGTPWGNVYTAGVTNTGYAYDKNYAVTTPASGATVNVANSVTYVDPATNIAALTVNLPTATDGQRITLVFSKAVTTITWTTAAGDGTGPAVPTTAAAGTVLTLMYLGGTIKLWRLR